MISIDDEIRQSRQAAEQIAMYDPDKKLWNPQSNPKPVDVAPNKVDFSGIKTTNGRKYNPEYISYIHDRLKKSNLSTNHVTDILANIIEESGGNPFALDKTGKFYGLLQWASDRYTPTGEKNVYKEIDNQVDTILATINNTKDKISWTHGGSGTGYNSLNDAYNDFNSDSLDTSMRGFTLGYVRPTGKLDSYNNRLKVAKQIDTLKGYRR